MSNDANLPAGASLGVQAENADQEGSVMNSLLGELRRASMTARTQESQIGFLGAFFESLPFPAWIKHIEGTKPSRYVRVNTAHTMLFGVAQDAIFGRTAADFIPAAEAQKSIDEDLEVVVKRAAIEFDTIYTARSTGLPYHWKGVRWPIYDKSGAVVGVCGFGMRGEAVQ